MSKESYSKVWEGVRLTAKNEMSFYLPRMVEGRQNPDVLTNLGRYYSHIAHLW